MYTLNPAPDAATPLFSNGITVQVGGPSTPQPVHPDTARLDWLQSTRNAPYTVYGGEWHPLTDGSGKRIKHPVFEGWSATPSGNHVMPTIREAIDEAMRISNGEVL
jgi:hypothetical protein